VWPIFPQVQYKAQTATNVNQMNKTNSTVQNKPMELPCFNFFLGGISTSFLATALSETKIRFHINILAMINV
jgi:hypothetical protein